MEQKKVRCRSCAHFNCYQDGEGEAQFGEMVCTSLYWEYECSINRKVFDKDKSVECNKYEPYRPK